ncbi:MAG: RNA-binding protein [Ramlibacter sp.]
MKAFHLEPRMTTLRGVFYPTGYMVLMFPSEQDARSAASRLDADGLAEDRVTLVTPDDFREQIASTIGDDDALPSPGTEGDTVRRFAELARAGHHALLVKAPSAAQSAHIMDVLHGTPISYGQRYRYLVIEDL